MKHVHLFPLLVSFFVGVASADESSPTAELLWQRNGETIDLMLRLDHWEADLEGFNVYRRVVSKDGQAKEWILLNEVEPLTPYAAPDKDLSNIEVDPNELEKLESFNSEQVGKVLKTTTKEEGWVEMLKPDTDNRTVRMLNYQVSQDYRLAKLVGLGLTDRQVPLLADGDELQYALFPVHKGKQGESVHSVSVASVQDSIWPTDTHFNVERRSKFAKDSILEFSWLPEQLNAHQVTGFMTFFRKKGSDDDFQPTSPRPHPIPAKGEYKAFHKWETEDSEYDYALACMNAFGSHGPLLPEGTSTEKFSVEDGPPIAPGVKLTNHYSKTFTITKLREPESKLRKSSMEKKTNSIGEIITTFNIHPREGKTYLIISHEADLEKVDLKCLVKVTNQREPLIPKEQMQMKVKDGKLFQFAELPVEDDDPFVVVTEVWTK